MSSMNSLNSRYILKYNMKYQVTSLSGNINAVILQIHENHNDFK